MTVCELELTEVAEHVRRSQLIAQFSAGRDRLDVMTTAACEITLRIRADAEQSKARRDADLVAASSKSDDSALDDPIRFVAVTDLQQAIREHAQSVRGAAHISDALVESDRALGAFPHRLALHETGASTPDACCDRRIAVFVQVLDRKRDPSASLSSEAPEKPKPLEVAGDRGACGDVVETVERPAHRGAIVLDV